MSARKKKQARGEFVWAVSGRTEHPACLVIPREEDAFNRTRNSEIEVRWTQTGRFEWVQQQRIRYEDTTNKQRRPSRRPSSKVQSTPIRRRLSTQKRSPNSVSQQKTPKVITTVSASYKVSSPLQMPPSITSETVIEFEQEEVKPLLAASLKLEDDTLAKVEEPEVKMVSILMESVKHEKRSLETVAGEDYLQPPAKKHKGPSGKITPPPLPPVECEVEDTKGDVEVEVEVDVDVEVEVTQAATAAITTQPLDMDDDSSKSVLENLSVPLSSAKEIVVSGLMELYKGFWSSSS